MDHCGWSGICFRGLKQSLYHFFAEAMLYEVPVLRNRNGNNPAQQRKLMKVQSWCHFLLFQQVESTTERAIPPLLGRCTRCAGHSFGLRTDGLANLGDPVDHLC